MSTEEENEISTLLIASIDLNSKSDEISLEDATWVDSCLVYDPQMSDDRWDTLREALLQTLTGGFVAGAAIQSLFKKAMEYQVDDTMTAHWSRGFHKMIEFV